MQRGTDTNGRGHKPATGGNPEPAILNTTASEIAAARYYKQLADRMAEGSRLMAQTSSCLGAIADLMMRGR
jgi:hypothetical protein